MHASERLDKIGSIASISCAIHCWLLPFILVALPSLGLAFLADQRVEWALALLSITLATYSLCRGRQQHGSSRALSLLAAAASLLLLGRTLETYHVGGLMAAAIVGLGGMGLAVSHLVNLRLCRTCPACHEC